jgi:hypothetical protein
MYRDPKHFAVLLLDQSKDTSFTGLLVTELERITELDIVRCGSPTSRENQRHWVANTALEIAKSTNERDILHVVAMGAVVSVLSDIAFANKASHRSINSYTFIDAIPEKLLPDWPDAPVTLIVTNQLSTLGQSAKLRGWDVVTVNDIDLHHTVAKTLQKFVL